MNIISVTNPIYSNPANTAIDCTVTFDTLGTVQYTSTANDNTGYGVALWAALQAGAHGAIGAYIAPPSPPPSPVDPLADLVNVLIANGTLTADQLQSTTITAVNTKLSAVGQSAISVSPTLKVTS